MNYIIDDNDSAKDFREFLTESKSIPRINGNVVHLNGDEFTFEKGFEKMVKEFSQYSSDLLYGKDKTEGIVAIEHENNQLIIYKNDGSHETKPGDYWYLTSNAIAGSERFKGSGHYKYLCKFRQEADMIKSRDLSYKMGGRNAVHRYLDPVEGSMVKDGYTLFKGLKLSDVSVLSFDIETTGLEQDSTSKVLLISNTFRDIFGKISRKLFAIDEFADEKQMIFEWCQWVVEIDPAIITGHNIIEYDLPYLNYCYTRNGPGSLPLGRAGRVIRFNENTTRFRKEANQFYEFHEPFIFGRQIIDGLFTSYKYDIATRKYTSNGLKQIIQQEKAELKERKKLKKASDVDLEFLARMDRPRTLWDFEKNPARTIYSRVLSGDSESRQMWKEFKEYCKDDADDSLILFDLMIPPYFYMSQIIPMQLQTINNTATGRQLNSIMCRAYIQDGYGVPKTNNAQPYGGGMSFGNPGVYKHVYKVDVASLYPSIIITSKISDPIKDPKGYFLELVTDLTGKRLDYKAKGKADKFFKDLSEAFKIFINSAYGLLGTKGLNFNNYELADKITSTGREILQTGVAWACGRRLAKEDRTLLDGSPKIDHETGEIEQEWRIDLTQKYPGNHFKLVNVDTDSFSYTTTRKLSEEDFAEHLKQINSLCVPGIKWERDGTDGYFEKILVVKTKNYVLKEPGKEIKIKGNGLRSRNREKALQDFQQRVTMLLLEDKRERIYHLYNQVAREIWSGVKNIEDWSKTKTVTNKVLNPTTPELKSIKKAITGKSVQLGDRIKLFCKEEGKLELVGNYDGNYDKDTYLNKLYSVLEIYETVIDINVFPNYKNKSNKELL